MAQKSLDSYNTAAELTNRRKALSDRREERLQSQIRKYKQSLPASSAD